MKISSFVFLVVFSIVVCDSRDSGLAKGSNDDSQLNERLTKKFNGKISEEKIEEYKENLRNKLDSVGSYNKESFKSKLQEKLAEMKDIFEDAMPKESEWFNIEDKINDEL